jgi:hypothetical protein
MHREHAAMPKEFAGALLAKGHPNRSDHGNPDTWPKKWGMNP